MPKFKYKAQNAAGKTVSSVMNATNEADLQNRLKADGLFLLKAKPVSLLASQKELKAQALAEFCRQIGTLLASGISLVKALGIVANEESISPAERAIYEELLRLVRQGMSLSEALEAQGEIFPPLLINMIKASETTGSMDKTALRLAVQYDKDYKVASKLKSSMTYPKVLIFLIIGVMIILMRYVMPKFEGLFSAMPELPWMTSVLFGISHFISSSWVLLAIILTGLILTWSVIARIKSVKLFLGKMKIHIWIFGKLNKAVYTARFARALSSLYSAGIPIVTSLSIAQNTIGNDYVQAQFEEVISKIKAGINLSEALRAVDGFTNKLASSVMVGEETGKLDSMLDSIADTLDYDSELAINRMVTYVEPAMIIFMGIIVAIMVSGVIMPIYSSYQFLGQ